MSYPVQEYHPLVIDTSYMYDVVNDNGDIEDKKVFENLFGFSVYDFILAVLSGNYVNITKKVVPNATLYNTVVIALDDETNISQLIIFKGSNQDSGYGGITINFSGVLVNTYDVETIVKQIDDNFLSVGYYEI